MLFPPHLSADDRYKRLVYIGSLAAAEPLETFATWTITGLAAIVALLISNLEAIQRTISSCTLHWGIIFLVAAMLLGALTKHFGIAIRTGVAVTSSLYQHLHSPEGQETLKEITIPPEKLPTELAKPFMWPIRQFIQKSARKGATDHLNAEKRFIKMLCLQIYFSYSMALFAAIGLIILACGIKT